MDYSQGRNYTAHLVWPNNMREGNESQLTLIGTSGRAPRSIAFSGPVGAVPPGSARAS